MNCPKCNSPIEKNCKYCHNCGTKISGDNDDTMSSNHGLGCCLFFFILAIGIMIFIVFIRSTNTNIPSIPEISLDSKAKNCEDQTVKDLVIEIFKENNKYYKSIAVDSILDVSLLYPAISSYDKEIDKYSCTGWIVMTSTDTGFLPLQYDLNNEYYSKIYFASPNYKTLVKYTKYKQYVMYDSQISEGNDLVQASDNAGEFSCDMNCGNIPDQKYIEEENKRQEQIKQEQIKKDTDNYLVLPD